MTLSLADKKVIVKDVSEVAGNAISLVAAEYKGLTVSEMTSLRQEARESGVALKVVRNTLAKRALTGTSFECISEKLSGPLFLAFSLNDPGSAARIVKKFSKTNEKLKVAALSISGESLDVSELSAMAELPTYDEAIAKLMLTMKAPVEKLARVLGAPHSKLVRTISAVRDQKQ